MSLSHLTRMTTSHIQFGRVMGDPWLICGFGPKTQHGLGHFGGGPCLLQIACGLTGWKVNSNTASLHDGSFASFKSHIFFFVKSNY